MSMIAVAILQAIITGVLLNFWIFMPYFTAKILKSADSLETYKEKKPQVLCLERTRKVLTFVFNCLYLALFIRIVVIVNENKDKVKEMSDWECSLPIVNAALGQLAENMANVRYYSYYILGLFTASIFMDLGDSIMNDKGMMAWLREKCRKKPDDFRRVSQDGEKEE